MQKKKRYTAEEKMMILREHLEKHIPISDLADKYGIHPNAIYGWRKQVIENAPTNLSKVETKRTERKHLDMTRKIAELEALLAKRETLIAELVEDNINLKKKSIGIDLIKNGLSRR